ncbi:MAG: omptin family outer membrane protease [Halanaerobium sp.]
MKKQILLLIILTVFLCIGTAQIAAAENNIEMGIKQLKGDTQYEISGGEWASELIFPLDSKIMEIKYEKEDFAIEGRDLYFKYGQTIAGDDISGFEDSDWLNGDSGRDIYSTGSVDLDSKTFDIGLKYHNQIDESRAKWAFVLGYQIIEHDSEVHSAVGHSGDSNILINNGETALIYESEYNIPYIGAGYNFKFSNHFSLSGSLKWSPISQVEDQDDHVLRNKVANSEADGNTYILNIVSDYEINRSWQGYLDASYSYSDLDGTQTQEWYGDDPATDYDDTGTRVTDINYENRQEVITLGFGFKYKF